MKRIVFFGLTLIIVLIFVVLFQYPDDKLRVVVCDVGQGDAILIQNQFTQIIIDGGPGNSLLTCLGKYVPFWDRQIEMVILTHPQADHANGLIGVFDRYDVSYFVASDYPGEGEFFERLAEVVSTEPSVKVVLPNQGKIIRWGNIELKLLWPENPVGTDREWYFNRFTTPENPVDDLNHLSTTVLLQYGRFRALFTGDLGLPEEQSLIRDGVLTDIDVLKVAHHGSKYSSSMDFLRVVKPEVSLISVGEHNSYGHPADETLQRLTQNGSTIYRTDQQGDLEVVTDGKSYQLNNQ